MRGYLVITVLEATGKNKDENFTWDSNNFEGFVKGNDAFLTLAFGLVWQVRAITSHHQSRSGIAGWIAQCQGGHQQEASSGRVDLLEGAAGSVSSHVHPAQVHSCCV